MRTVPSLVGVRFRTVLIGLLMAIPATLLPLTHATATNYTVYPDGSGDYPNIQAAYDVAESGDTILLADGIFTGPGNHDLVLDSVSLTIRSLNGDPEECILDLEDHDIGIFEVYMELLRFQTITFRNGGGIYSSAGFIEMYNCAFEGMAWVLSASEWGAGEVVNSFFTGGTNSQLRTGAHANGCTFQDNRAKIVSSSYTTLEDCLFLENFSATQLIEAREGPMGTSGITIRDCQFIDNSVDEALVMVRSHLTCAGTTFAGNTGTCIEIAPWVEPYMGMYVEVSGSTFVGNSDPDASSIFYDFPWEPDLGNFSVSNCLFAFNTAGPSIACIGDPVIFVTCSDIFGNDSGDWIDCIADQLGVHGNISEDPYFCYEHAAELYMLEASSPCAPFSPPNATCDLIGAWDVGCDLTDVDETIPAAVLSKVRAVPNPFRSSTRIVIPEGMVVDPGARFEIFDTAGRLVYQVDLNRRVSAGDPMIWDGSDLAGRALPSGIYYGKLSGITGGKAEPILVVR